MLSSVLMPVQCILSPTADLAAGAGSLGLRFSFRRREEEFELLYIRKVCWSG